MSFFCFFFQFIHGTAKGKLSQIIEKSHLITVNTIYIYIYKSQNPIQDSSQVQSLKVLKMLFIGT